jgi:NitT/TauT family transport system permease protein
MDKTKKRRIQILAASVFWLGVWQAAAVAIGQEVFLVSPVQAIGTLVELLPQAEFWQRIGFSAGRILLGFGLGVLSSAVLAVAAEKWEWVDALLAPVMQLVKATPVASFIILALVWVSGSSLSVLISFLMVLPVLYSAVRTAGSQTARRRRPRGRRNTCAISRSWRSALPMPVRTAL